MTEDNNLVKQYEELIQQERLKSASAQLGQEQRQVSEAVQDKGMIHEQLDVGEILDRIHHLLRGFVMKRVDGEMKWVAPEDNDQIVLTDHGINYVMGAVQWYLNKNTLLSNYKDDIINQKMLDFATTIIDDVFMEYDKMFLYPTLEECYAELEARIDKKIDTRYITSKIAGLERKKEEIRKTVIKEMEGRFEREITQIREQKIKNKLKRFESIMRFIQDTVHSAYNRAWNGQERTTLRQHIHISEQKGQVQVPQQQGGAWNPFKRR